MGRGIAHAAALGGYRTILEDILPNALRRAESWRSAPIWTRLSKSANSLPAMRTALSPACSTPVRWKKRRGSADLVIEAVPEEMEVEDRDFHASRQDLPANNHFCPQHQVPYVARSPGLPIARRKLSACTSSIQFNTKLLEIVRPSKPMMTHWPRRLMSARGWARKWS